MDKSSPKITGKEIALGLFSIAAGFAFFRLWHAIAVLIVSGDVKNYTNFILPLAALVLSASIFSLAALFIKNKWVVYLSAVASTAIVFFLLQATTTVLIAFLLTSLLAIFSAFRIRKEYDFSIWFNLSRILKRGLPLYFTVTALIISVFYFEAVQINNRQAFSAVLPKAVTRVALKIVSSQLKSILGGVSVQIKPEATVNELISQIVISQSQKQGFPVSGSDLTRLVSLERQDLSKRFGVPLEGDEKIVDAFHSLITERLEEMLGSYKIYLPYITAAAFFLAMKTLAFPLYYLAVLLDFLLIKIAISAKILKKEKRQVEAERLVL